MRTHLFAVLSIILLSPTMSAFANPIPCTDNELYRDLPSSLNKMITQCFKIPLDEKSMSVRCKPYSFKGSGIALCKVNFMTKSGRPYSLRDVETLVEVPDRALILVASERWEDEQECSVTGFGHRLAVFDDTTGEQNPKFNCLLGD